MLDMILDIEVKSHYGKDLFYVVGDKQDAIQELIGKAKTCSEKQLAALKHLGFMTRIVKVNGYVIPHN